MDLQETQVSLESRAEWVEPGTRDLLASVTQQPVREQQQPENPPTPKTIKRDFLRPDAIHQEEERQGKINGGSDTKNHLYLNTRITRREELTGEIISEELTSNR